MKPGFALQIALLCASSTLPGQKLMTAELKPPTIQAFDRYVRNAESVVEERVRGQRTFLWTDESRERRAEVLRGDIALERRSARADIPDGSVEDWIGAVFVPGVTLEKVLSLVQDYDNHKNIYQPEVVDSRLFKRNGDEFQIGLRLRKHKVITVVLDTEHSVRYFRLDRERSHSRSLSTRIAEVSDPGEPGERKLPPGRDHGFMWRLNSYWRFQQRDGGVFIECEAISLSRDIPFAVSWLVKPIVRDLPRESLENTLRLTRDAVSRQDHSAGTAGARH
jgi:hypothetical protein